MCISFGIDCTHSVSNGCNSFGIVLLGVCLCVCLSLMAKRTDVWTWFLAGRSNGRISRSSLKVKVISQRSSSPGQKGFPTGISIWCLLELRHVWLIWGKSNSGMYTEATEAHFFPQESSSAHRFAVGFPKNPTQFLWKRTQFLWVELDSCAKGRASVVSVDVTEDYIWCGVFAKCMHFNPIFCVHNYTELQVHRTWECIWPAQMLRVVSYKKVPNQLMAWVGVLPKHYQ